MGEVQGQGPRRMTPEPRKPLAKMGLESRRQSMVVKPMRWAPVTWQRFEERALAAGVAVSEVPDKSRRLAPVS